MIERFPYDEELDLLRGGGEEAIAELVVRYRAMLLRMIALRLDRRVFGKVDGNDILQDTFVIAARRRKEFLAKPTVPFFIWLRQIASQVLVDVHRRYLGTSMRDVNHEVTLHNGSACDEGSASLVIQLADSFTSPSQFAVRGEMVAGLRVALEQMEPIDREILVLRHLEELTNNEVAQILGIEKYAASKRYLRALERLRCVMTAEHGTLSGTV